uniref:Uncharacterized protein n=1 Tax=Chloropicon laureae TaxID=464258 RepID=A0A7S2Z1Z1_9CHLO|mmetsp:Transcript_2285/g.5757  ORF Transcript_2285/g.5757 Transcript_2285/m.5757 type:complete len:165 (+) Transcript_2285:97-591(+)|eukprot:CAMPEP_0197494370 /NCGR_PEP_ID=MMETSP1311-20131121/29461_1 /TAXON_ID=464262 /ORGANISM="Genus nov. species nov., Strain RCC856" /LENGTH=164 /DNA_ID=CAMNT_0043039749 /DNA_START=21 /DNA_END=515 /DNA_ORIENTATION=+
MATTKSMMNVSRTRFSVGRSAGAATRLVTRAKVKNEVPVSEKEFRKSLGFTEKDSAGQSNIFAVEPRVYVQGEENTALVLAISVVGLVAAGGLGYTLISEKEAEVDTDLAYLFESGETLAQYQKKFAPPKPAPVAVPVAVEAPPVQVEAAAPAVAVEATEAPME